MPDPLVSVVVPVYNREHFVVQAIDSIFHQTYKNYEVIVVDDCSTDGTVRALSRFITQQNFKLIRLKENCGVSEARNAAIRKAKGEYLAFLDSDDCWYPSFLDDHMRVLREDQSICICASDFDFIDDEGNVTESSSGIYQSSESSFRQLKYHDPNAIVRKLNFLLSTVVMRKEIVKRVGMFESQLRYSEDLNFWLRSASCCKIAELTVVLASYRKHSIQATSSSINILRGRYEAILTAVRSEPRLKRMIAPDLLRMRLSQDALQIAGHYYWLEGDSKRAMDFYAKAIRHDPLNRHAFFRLAVCFVPMSIREKVRKAVRSFAQR